MISSKSTKQWRSLEIECDKLVTDIVLWVDLGRCAFCTSTYMLSPHHIIKRTNKHKRHDPNNIILLCKECHDQAENSEAWCLCKLEEKYPKMHEWHEANQQEEVMQFYKQHLDKIYQVLRRIQVRMRGETSEMRERFRRV